MAEVRASQKRRFLLRRGAGCEAGGGDSRVKRAAARCWAASSTTSMWWRSWRRWGPDRWTPWRRSARGETVIIRSHGERKEVFDAAGAAGSRVCQRHLSQRAADPAAGGAGRRGRGVAPSSSASPSIRRSWVWPAGADRSVMIFGRPEELEKWLLQEPSRQVSVPDGGGSDHLHPDNFGKLLEKF